MAIIRLILGKIILVIDRLTRPKRPQRTDEAQAELDRRTAGLALYEFYTCPFCVKTRRAVRRLGLNIETRDARNNPDWRSELIDQGGKYQVPCLRITHRDGSVSWMYESADIINYLNNRFG